MPATKRDYYEVLGIQKTAAPEQVKAAYRALAKKFHPDMNRDNQKAAEEKFKEISEAYEVLMDKDKRAKYDQFGHAGVDPSFGAGGFDFRRDFSHSDDLQDIFGSLFGGAGAGGAESIFDMLMGGGGGGRRRGGARDRRGGDLQIHLPLTLEEIATGVEKTIQLKRQEGCPECHGSGVLSGADIKDCPTCKGAGEVRQVSRSMFGQFINVQACPQCGGEGKIISNPCKACDGAGRIKKDATIQIKVPGGAAHGNYIPMRGQGHIGAKNGPSGDLIVHIDEREHPLFTRHGDDVVLGVYVSYPQAALGAKVKVPMLHGSAELSIPAGTPSGKIFRMRGKGLPHVNSSGSGDQLVRVEVWVPGRVSGEEKKALKAMGEAIDAKVPGPHRVDLEREVE